MNHRKYLRRALTLTVLSIPFILFAFAYMAFAIPADGLQTVGESLIAFIPLAAGVAMLAAGWIALLCALTVSGLKTIAGWTHARMLQLLHKIQLKHRTSSSRTKDGQHGKITESPKESEMEQR